MCIYIYYIYIYIYIYVNTVHSSRGRREHVFSRAAADVRTRSCTLTGHFAQNGIECAASKREEAVEAHEVNVHRHFVVFAAPGRMARERGSAVMCPNGALPGGARRGQEEGREGRAPSYIYIYIYIYISYVCMYVSIYLSIYVSISLSLSLSYIYIYTYIQLSSPVPQNA